SDFVARRLESSSRFAARAFGGTSLPHANSHPSEPPRAARSHSSSVGSRSPAQSHQAFASAHEIPLAGYSPVAPSGRAAFGLDVAAANRSHCSHVTSVRATRKAGSFTRCAVPSSGLADVSFVTGPIVNSPAGTRTITTLGSLSRTYSGRPV